MSANVENTVDMDNPAMSRLVKSTSSPGAVAEAMEDPSVFEMVARGDLYLELTRLRKLAGSSAMPIKARLEYAQFLSKMGKVDKPDTGDNPLHGIPAINIYLPGTGQRVSAGATVQGEYTEKEV